MQNSFTEIAGALKFYQNLSGNEKKFADRIIALRNVNEQYVLHPGLSNYDRQYYLSLPHVNQLKIQRLAQFFEFGNNAQQTYSDQDLTYLRSLNSKDRSRVLRIATRIGLGMDKDNYVAFSDRDWNYYKKIPEGEIAEMKTVAQVLKDNGQSFSLSLADGFLENDPAQPIMAKYQPREELKNEVYTTEQSSDIAQQTANSKSDENSQVNENPKKGGNGMFSISVGNNQKSNGDIYHVVKDGETVRSIAKQYDKKPRTLKELNNIKGNKLKPGIKLLIEKKP